MVDCYGPTVFAIISAFIYSPINCIGFFFFILVFYKRCGTLCKRALSVNIIRLLHIRQFTMHALLSMKTRNLVNSKNSIPHVVVNGPVRVHLSVMNMYEVNFLWTHFGNRWTYLKSIRFSSSTRLSVQLSKKRLRCVSFPATALTTVDWREKKEQEKFDSCFIFKVY